MVQVVIEQPVARGIAGEGRSAEVRGCRSKAKSVCVAAAAAGADVQAAGKLREVNSAGDDFCLLPSGSGVVSGGSVASARASFLEGTSTRKEE